MGKLIVIQNMTLDGVIESTGGWFDSVDNENNDDMVEVVRQHSASEAALLLGRKTFESFRGYWPKQTDDTTGVTAHLNQVPKYVLSETLQEPEWQNTTILRGDAAEEARTLVAQIDGEIGITGSITLVHALIAAGLVDEYRLFVYPVVMGSGRRLFENATDVDKLELVEVRPFRSGIVLLTYRRSN